MLLKKQRIYLSSPHMGGTEKKYVNEAFKSNWIAPLGPNVDAFEESLSKFCDVRNVAALSSGTSAIHLALVLLGVKPGDEVIASTFTFSATVNPIRYLGATPILVDSEPDTWNMDPDLLEQAILDRLGNSQGKSTHNVQHTPQKLPKALILVHLYGMPANLDEIIAIASKYDIPVIEDAAEALGSRYKGKPLGSFGKFGVLSFNGNKIITTSGGGALMSDDGELITKARFLATQARDSAPHYEHSQIGYNYRLSNVLASIGRGQMEVIDLRIQQRRFNYEFYYQNLKDLPGISFVEEPSDDFFSNRWLTPILIDPLEAGITRQELQTEFEKENIETRPLWKPMHLQPIFSSCPAYINGTSENLFKNGLCLPSGSNLSDMDRKLIMKILIRKLKR